MVPPSEARRILEMDTGSSLSSLGRVGAKIEDLEKNQIEKTMTQLDWYSNGGFRATFDAVKLRFKMFSEKILVSWEEKATARYENKQDILKEEWKKIAGDEFPFVKDKNGNRIVVSDIEDIKKYGMTGKERIEMLEKVKKESHSCEVIKKKSSLTDKISNAEKRLDNKQVEKQVGRKKDVGLVH